MNDTEFKELTRDRDRRGEDPTELNLEINDNGEQLAFEMHCIWCQEANHFTPIEYAKHKLGQGIHGKPEQLQEITGILPLSLLSEDKLGIVADLAEKDGEVWFYLKEWFLNGLAGDPRPDLIPPALTSLVRLMINGEKPNTRSQPTVIKPYLGKSSAKRFAIHSNDCLGVSNAGASDVGSRMVLSTYAAFSKPALLSPISNVAVTSLKRMIAAGWSLP